MSSSSDNKFTPGQPFFSAQELNCRHCGRPGINEKFLALMQTFRERLQRPLVVTSAYRCRQHPVEAAKRTPGNHNLGVAVDWFCPALPLEDLYREIVAFGQFDGVGVSLPGGFIHCDVRASRVPARWQYNATGKDVPWDGAWASLKKP